ncbi:MAG: hypothetical protein M1813_003194 [Trichoglossum hirsutum]|nr:MAG: hypothetical protein M1813_003194 [Trichoglossum hirsutum]
MPRCPPPPPSSLSATQLPDTPPPTHPPLPRRQSIWGVFPVIPVRLRPSDRFREDSQYYTGDDEISLNLGSSERFEGSKRDASEVKNRWSWTRGYLPWGNAKGEERIQRGQKSDVSVAARGAEASLGIEESLPESAVKLNRSKENKQTTSCTPYITQNPYIISFPKQSAADASIPYTTTSETSSARQLQSPESADMPRPPPLVHFHSHEQYRRHHQRSSSRFHAPPHRTRSPSTSWAWGSLPRMCSEYWRYGILGYTPAYLSPRGSGSGSGDAGEGRPSFSPNGSGDGGPANDPTLLPPTSPLTPTNLLLHHLSHRIRNLPHHALNALSLILALPFLIPYEIIYASVRLARATAKGNGSEWRRWRRGGRRRGCAQGLQNFLSHSAVDGVVGWGVFCGVVECVGACVGACLEKR